MKIALVTPYQYPYPGGVTEHVAHLDQCFREWGHEVKILAPVGEDAPDVPENVIRMGKRITPVHFAGSISRLSLSPRIYRPVKQLLEREQFDIIHLHEPLMPALPLIVLRHSKTINVGTFHAYRETPHWGLETLGAFFELFHNKLHGKICVSQAALELISRYYPGDYAVIPNGIDVNEFGGPEIQPIEKYMDGRPNILFVGRMEKRKGFRYLMRAFPYVVEAIPEARLIVAGAYEKEDKEPFVRYARMHKLNSIKFVGRISQAELPRYYKTCDVFCAPSTGFESFGIVLLEAMAAGKPIVATDIFGYRSVVDQGQEGMLVEPENERALAEAIIILLRNPNLRRDMGERGQRKAARYDWPLVARQVLAVYEELLKQRREGKLDVE